MLLIAFLTTFRTLPLITQFPLPSGVVARSKVLNLLCCRLHWKSFATWQNCLVSSSNRNAGVFPNCLWIMLSVKKLFIVFVVTVDNVDVGSWYSSLKNTGFQFW